MVVETGVEEAPLSRSPSNSERREKERKREKEEHPDLKKLEHGFQNFDDHLRLRHFKQKYNTFEGSTMTHGTCT